MEVVKIDGNVEIGAGLPKAIQEALADQTFVLFHVPSLISIPEGLIFSAITFIR